MSKSATFNPGRVQLQVLAGLASDEASVRTLARNWPGLSEGSVRSAVMSLGRRGLVDPVRWNGNERLWGLTYKGSAWVEQQWGDDVPDDFDTPTQDRK